MIFRASLSRAAAGLQFLGLIFLALLFTNACNSPQAESGGQTTPAPPVANAGLEAGKTIFTRRCAVCHGADGKKGLNGAHDLTKSNLNATGRVYMVTKGLGKMPSFQQQLTLAEIEQVVAYSLTLR